MINEKLNVKISGENFVPLLGYFKIYFYRISRSRYLFEYLLIIDIFGDMRL